MGSQFCTLRRHTFANFLFSTFFVAVLLAGTMPAGGQTFSTIYTFSGGALGAYPGGLVAGKGAYFTDGLPLVASPRVAALRRVGPYSK